MSDIEIGENLEEESSKEVSPFDEPPSESPIVDSLNNNNVVEKKLYTITTFRIHPNGQLFINKTQSWFDKAGAVVKKKPKKIAEMKKAELSKEESY